MTTEDVIQQLIADGLDAAAVQKIRDELARTQADGGRRGYRLASPLDTHRYRVRVLDQRCGDGGVGSR